MFSICLILFVVPVRKLWPKDERENQKKGKRMPAPKANKNAVPKNRRSIFEVEAAVTANRAKAYAATSIIEENQAGISKNYTAAFTGYRQLANQNTDDVFRNRKAIISNIEATTPIEENFRESLLNEAGLEFLEHRANLDSTF